MFSRLGFVVGVWNIRRSSRSSLTLLGHHTRLAEWNRSYMRSGKLIERMNLPTDWTSA